MAAPFWPHKIIVVRPLPLDGNNKEEHRFKKFKDLPIIIAPLRILNNESQHEDRFCSLIWCNKETEVHQCSFCNCLLDITIGYYYISDTFSNSKDVIVCFHKECVDHPIEKNPYHPQHSLHVLMYYLEGDRRCHCCYGNKKYFHYCSVCDFGICHECDQGQPQLTIKHQIRHKHTLNYIHRKASITCNICALDDRRYFIYMCYQCDFVVHKECIYFPRTIRISGHDHQLNFTYSFYAQNCLCQVCRDIYDENYGGYLCKFCPFLVHSKCAIAVKEHEGKSEDAYDNVSCLHCKSHPPSMRFHKEIYKANKKEEQCQLCALPLHDAEIFSCTKCEFVLHEVCARLPKLKMHMVHPHLLTIFNYNDEGIILKCSACKRVFNKYHYSCNECDFILDVNCASIPDALNYHSHNHLLFQASITGSSRICSICQKSQTYYLECEECDIAFCFGCVTLPKIFTYKHDEHPLIFSFGQDVSGEYWCDMCEDKINQQYGIYMCNDCNIALHVECLIGKDIYILQSTKLILNYMEDNMVIPLSVDVLLNNRLTRYIYNYCQKRCQHKLIFKDFSGEIFCSGSCLVNYIKYGPLDMISDR